MRLVGIEGRFIFDNLVVTETCYRLEQMVVIDPNNLRAAGSRNSRGLVASNKKIKKGKEKQEEKQ